MHDWTYFYRTFHFQNGTTFRKLHSLIKVFRLDPIPERSRYLGTIEILMVRPHEAVGRPTSRAPMSIRPGDRVASRLLVGGN